MTKALESLEKGSRRNDADIGIQLQKTVEDLAKLRGQVETYLYKISELEAALGRLPPRREKKQLAQQGADALKEAEAKKQAEALKRPEDKKEFLALAQEKAKAGELAAGAPALLGVHEEVGQGSADGRGALRHGRDVLHREQVPRGALRVRQGDPGLREDAVGAGRVPALLGLLRAS